jgi:tRNA U34 5-methylaminomethyl-2-thiouridine-forming methyltransferase MnmC
MDNNELLLSDDGSHTINSGRFGVTYHSRYGAIHESITVFLSAGLQYKLLKGHSRINIFEMGLGTGLNALLSMMESDRYQSHITYTAIEKFPLSIQQASNLNYIEQLNAFAYKDAFLNFHNCSSSDAITLTPFFTFNKIIGDIVTSELGINYDIIYFDAFAPNAQEELWTNEVMKKMYSILNNNGILVSYCAKGSFKRALKSAGFKVEAIPGPPGKREMTRAHKN